MAQVIAILKSNSPNILMNQAPYGGDAAVNLSLGRT